MWKARRDAVNRRTSVEIADGLFGLLVEWERVLSEERHRVFPGIRSGGWRGAGQPPRCRLYVRLREEKKSLGRRDAEDAEGILGLHPPGQVGLVRRAAAHQPDPDVQNLEPRRRTPHSTSAGRPLMGRVVQVAMGAIARTVV